MIYTFKCKSTGDVLMNGPVADQLLRIVGKPPAAKGILQPGDLLQDIQAVERAVAEDEARLSALKAASPGKPATGDDAEAEAVTLRQHAWPLVEMMKQAQAAGDAIVWGV
jgi:hypothetical protein